MVKIMEFFEKYVSNCTAGTGNQSFFVTEDRGKTYTARAFFKPTVTGKHEYAFLFSNVIDSTYSDGSHSRCGKIPDEWLIDSARVCVCDPFDAENFVPLTFGGKARKTVSPGEFFVTDGVVLSPRAGQYICVELSFCGNEIPFHPETLVPVFVKNGNAFEESKNMPLPAMIGCDLDVRKRIAFWGDSITQGIGTVPDSYTHYAAVVSDILGDEYAYWDIGIGFGRASDAASDGSWAFKAKQNDVVTVCFGVNDIFKTGTSPKYEIEKAVKLLKESGAKVIVQTVPPFDYDEYHKKIWEETNDYVKNVLAPVANGFLDVTEFLSVSEEHKEKARFGGHPNAEGSAIWGKRLAEVIENVCNASN